MSKYGGGLRLKAGGGYEEGAARQPRLLQMGQGQISAYFGPRGRRHDAVQSSPGSHSEAFVPKPHTHETRYA
jgi:hypothetical protein